MSAPVKECPECGRTMYPWEFDGECGWGCDSCGYQEDSEEWL